MSNYKPPKRGKRKPISTIAKTLRELRAQGIMCDKCESFNPHVGPFGARRDLFGFADIIAIGNGEIIAIQTCAGSGFKDHYKKIIENESALAWIKYGNGAVELWAWRKVKKVRGGKQMVWSPRIHRFTLADFGDEEGGY